MGGVIQPEAEISVPPHRPPAQSTPRGYGELEEIGIERLQRTAIKTSTPIDEALTVTVTPITSAISNNQETDPPSPIKASLTSDPPVNKLGKDHQDDHSENPGPDVLGKRRLTFNSVSIDENTSSNLIPPQKSLKSENITGSNNPGIMRGLDDSHGYPVVKDEPSDNIYS